MIHQKRKVIVILGPTASGKTKLAVRLAREIQGEIISADSRQVYKKLDIGSGKDLSEYGKIRHHLIDILAPGVKYSAAKFQNDALRCLEGIAALQHIPIICGGTGYYVKSLIADYEFVSNASNIKNSQHLESLSRQELYDKLKQLGAWNDHSWVTDSKRRMARAIEKATFQRKPTTTQQKFNDKYVARIYTTRMSRDELRTRIHGRLQTRMANGLLDEVSNLVNEGVDPKFLDSLGLEYRWTYRHLSGELTLEQLFERLYTDICRFAKRQTTYLRYMQKTGHEIHRIESWDSFRQDALDWLDHHTDKFAPC